MANLSNPLDKFRSHSVHYIVLACRNTESVRAFTDGSENAATESLRAVDSCQRLGDEVRLNGNGGVFLMIDTRRFSQFLVTNFKLDTLTAGFSPNANTPNSTAIDMSFTVLDSTGISFANFLQYLMDQKLQVSFDGMTVLVRVLFIGHEEDGRSSIVQSVTIPAIINAIQVDLNEARGSYDCSFFPLIGMPSNGGYNAKWTSIGSASTFFTGDGGNTLGAMVRSFESRVNAALLKRYTSFNAQTQNQGTKTSAGRYGRPVQYMITIPPEWEAFTFTGPTQGGSVETEFKRLIEEQDAQKAKTATEAQKKAQQNTKAPAKDSYLGVPPSCTVTEVLDIIFSQVTRVRELANFTRTKDKDGNIRFYKHLVTVTSDDTSFTVHIDVVEFIVPNVELAEKAQAASTSELDQQLYEMRAGDAGGQPKKLPRNFIELDYIFSGTNIDVLQLDLKIENLNWLLMQNTKLGQGEIFDAANDAQKQTNGEGSSEDQRLVNGMRKMDPTLMPQRTNDEATNHANIAGNVGQVDGATPQAISQQYMQNLSAFYNAGPVTAKLELRGNPDIMASVALQTMPQHVSAVTITDAGGLTSSTNESVKKQYRENLEVNVLRIRPPAPKSAGDFARYDRTPNKGVASPRLTGPSFVASPVFVKVNVYGPNVDFLTQETIAGQDFARQLFYDNYYYLSKITSKIDGGKFTQEMELLSYSVYGQPTKNAKGTSNVTTNMTSGAPSTNMTNPTSR